MVDHTSKTDRVLKILKIKKEESLREFYIPEYIFEPELEVEKLSYTPQCPVVVFINSKSGGQLGGELLITYRELLNKVQVLSDLLEAGAAFEMRLLW